MSRSGLGECGVANGKAICMKKMHFGGPRAWAEEVSETGLVDAGRLQGGGEGSANFVEFSLKISTFCEKVILQ